MATYSRSGAAQEPRYGLAEAARYVRLSPSTLRSWTLGRSYDTASGTRRFPPVIKIADKESRLLSFENLIEAHVLSALRVKHHIDLKSIRTAIRYVERELKIGRLLLSPELKAGAGSLFVERFGQLIDVSQSGQLAIQDILKSYLRRVVWEDAEVAAFYPFLATGLDIPDQSIVIRPDRSFGKPTLANGGISTAVITDRFDAGESIEALADDYSLGPDAIRSAILYERAA
ncbi:MAG: DUF433 domain-containing protein [Candidatus Krumholzibacteriia bacterium]